jgi:integrase
MVPHVHQNEPAATHGSTLIIEHAGRRDGPCMKLSKLRRVGMRFVVRQTLMAIWQQRGRPDAGQVFLNKLGKPYPDTGQLGGNPLTSRTETARRKAGITGFRIHDWRHHFAVWLRQTRRQPAGALPDRRVVLDAYDPAIRRIRAE